MRALTPMETRFEIRDLIKVLTLSVILYGLFTGLIYFMPNLSAFLEGLHPSASFSISYLILFVILFFPLWLFAVSPRQASLKDFAFQRPKSWPKSLLHILIGYLFYIATSILILITLYSQNIENLFGFQEQQAYLPFFGEDTLGILVATGLITLIAPFIEEVFFRGFIFRTLAKSWPMWVASLTSAVIFAAIHFQFANIVPLIILGLILNELVRRSGSLWPAILFHIFNNAIAFGLELNTHFTAPESLELFIRFLY